MDRRRFLLTSVAGAVGAPLAVEAQKAGPMPRVGWLSLLSGSDPQAQSAVERFRQALRELGYVEGQSVAIEYRWAEGSPNGFSTLLRSWPV
jgi:putative ABC transport system substrate-binding protein